ncbi:UNVERIFIED_CONTAM: putative LRR receptor-like serine/threonine-protein kinase [Sesamum latifolium]|uniref:LRR receptor-like serine/threonine-protein kinase n=1 Tax=Sesamum latifolium TaxID=2727402 RepID=A0AAW2TSA0_9LAMI
MREVGNFVAFFGFILMFLAVSGSAAVHKQRPQLHQDEVRALREIARRLGKKDWDFSKDPCSGEGNWTVALTRKGFESNVTCDCSFDQSSTCHVVSMYVFPFCSQHPPQTPPPPPPPTQQESRSKEKKIQN